MVIENDGNNDLKFKNPEQLLLVVVAFVFWSVGFLDLLGHTSAAPDVFGVYSLPFFAFIILYGSTIIFWLVLFLNNRILSRFAAVVSYIQTKTWLVFTILIGLGGVLGVTLEWDRWSRLPGLQFSVFSLVLLSAAILIFSGWREYRGRQWWRKVIAYPLFALVAIEAVIQILAFAGALPGHHEIGGNFTPYERIYYNQEGFRNGFANRYGWYFPDFSLDDDNRRVLILGGSHVQALEVPPDQQISTYLSEMIDQNQNEKSIQTEVISIGLPGFGPSPYLYEGFLSELMMEPGALIVDEIIVLFHLGNDFQGPSQAADPIVYMIDEKGSVAVHPDSAKLRHDLTHYFMRGYLSFQLVETIRSNYLTPKVIAGIVRDRINVAEATTEMSLGDNEFDFHRLRGMVTSNFMLTEPQHAGIRSTELVSISRGNNFLFKNDGNEDAHQAAKITHGLLETAQEVATANNITLRIVTIPAFPPTFFNRFQGNDWESEIGDYDLFLPEEIVIDSAQAEGIAVLPMGRYMYENKLTAEEIAQFYFSNGQGHFTPAGHNYFAEAIYSCFYSDANDNACFK